MNYILVSIKNLQTNLHLIIDCQNKTININNKILTIKENKIDDLLRIIRTWKENYYSNKIIDAESFTIKIITDNNTYLISGCGEYPDNYFLFKNWIGEFYD